ncbi:CoA transferase [Streptomyces albus]|nr:CoA transferase [Streptomyces albus]
MTDTATTGPLHGVRVVELAGIGPGPFAAMLLADLGADVVRVDRPGGRPRHRPRPRPHQPQQALRPGRPQGRGRCGPGPGSGGARADILVEGYRPGVAERLGIGPDACLARNPRLVYGRMTGWGQEGPLADRAGHDIGYIAVTGTLGLVGEPDAPPAVPANLVGDYAGGSLYLVTGVLAALHHARAHGAGQVVDAAIVDGTAHLTTMIHAMLGAGVWQDRRRSNLLDGGAPSTAATPRPTAATWPWAPWSPGSTPSSPASSACPRTPRASSTWPAGGRTARGGHGPLRHPHPRGVDRAVRRHRRLRRPRPLPGRGGRSPAPRRPGDLHHPRGPRPARPGPRFSATPTAVRTGPALPGADTAEVARDWGLGPR